ncbi:MAG: hypothetical protein AAF846_24825 [Chloroflexota bacterium]
MTNSGLYADLHQQMRELADLVDEVLTYLRQDHNQQFIQRTNLAQRLTQLAEPDPQDLADRLLSINLGVNQNNNRQKWQSISQKLYSTETDKSIIGELETFAYLLEQHQADALAKMRGWIK